MTKRILRVITAGMLTSMATPASAVTTQLFYETFDGIVNTGTDWYQRPTVSTNNDYVYGDPSTLTWPRQEGAPRQGNGTTVSDGADENWYGATFRQPNNAVHDDCVGLVYPGYECGGITSAPVSAALDIGVQPYRDNKTNEFGITNPTTVGLMEDDSGLLFRLDTTGFNNINLTFDWNSYQGNSEEDSLEVGYFVGDFTNGLDANRIDTTYNTFDLRDSAAGGTDGAWNYDALGSGWNKLMSDFNKDWTFGEAFDLTLASDEAEIWVAFWLRGGEHDHANIDNISVTGVSAIPVPASVWLFASGLIGLLGISRRRAAK
jgi:hypothetical protein